MHLSGIAKAVSALTTFPRTGDMDGKVMRVTLADESGQITAVVWNEKAAELETLKPNSRLLLINARIKDGQNGGFEAHVDSSTYVNVQTSPLTVDQNRQLSGKPNGQRSRLRRVGS